jgi:hypothetical protein
MVGIEKAVEKQISLRLAEVNDKIVAVLLNEEEKIYREALNANAAVVSALTWQLAPVIVSRPACCVALFPRSSAHSWDHSHSGRRAREARQHSEISGRSECID